MKNKIKQGYVFICNAFSLQMLKEDVTISVTEIEKPEDLSVFKSAVGHADTAACLGVEMKRENVQLSPGDVVVVAQLQGGRLPEGSTTLPEGCTFKFLEVKIWPV